MLFLVRAEIGRLPAGELGTLLERIEQEWEMVVGLLDAGHILACGRLVERRGAVAIFEVADRHALERVVARLPLAPYFVRVDIEPLEPARSALTTARRRRRAYALRAARRAPVEAREGG